MSALIPLPLLTGTLQMSCFYLQILLQSPLFYHPSLKIQLLQVLQPIFTRFSAQYMHQVILPVGFLQYFHQNPHFRHRQDHIFQSLQKTHHLLCLQGRIIHLCLLNQLTLPVYIPTHSHQRKNHRNPLPMSPPNKSPQVCHHHSLLITHQ